MASVTSLDQDMRKLRLDRYTPGAANEIRGWIEEVLGERLQPGDLMEALKDGVALCKLVNLVTSPGVRYKASNMPFVQMENISHYLKACEMPPLNLPSHDRFLTVDLYDGKDPAQVLQCIAAFSRRANALKPSTFQRSIGPMSKGGSMSPQGTGGTYGKVSPYTTSQSKRDMPPVHESPTTFNPLNKAAYSGRISPTKQSSLGRGGLATGGPVSSWTTKGDESKTAPAWNIHQYGYMGGASQGNQGVSFGARRQITSAAPHVPSLAEKEKIRKAAEEHQRQEEEENQRRLQAEREADEARAREEEEHRWAEETRRAREREEQDKKRIERESARRELQERREAEDREQEQREAQMAKERARQRTTSDARLNGQFLSQYQAGQTHDRTAAPIQAQATPESQRIKDLERQLEEMRSREREQQSREQPSSYEEEAAPELPARPSDPPAPALPSRPPQIRHDDDGAASERDFLKKEWQATQQSAHDREPSAPRPAPSEPALPARPLPEPSTYASGTNRTDRYLASNPAPRPTPAASHRPSDYSTTTEVDLENQRRAESQAKTKAGGWASKSLLEREMERERERQREWEEGQKATATAAKDVNEGSGPGQSWDVHQYGYTGGDSQNRGGAGLGVGGARRQIIGPRPPPR